MSGSATFRGLFSISRFPAENFGANVFEDGLMFDGSSIRGFQEIHESDMLLMPDPSTACHRPVPPAQDADPDLLRA